MDAKIYFQDQKNSQARMLTWDTKCINDKEQEITLYFKNSIKKSLNVGDFIANDLVNGKEGLFNNPFAYKILSIISNTEAKIKGYNHIKALSIRTQLDIEFVKSI